MTKDRSCKLVLCTAVLAAVTAALAPSQACAAAVGGRGAPAAGAVSSGTASGPAAASTGGGAGPNGGGGPLVLGVDDEADTAVGIVPVAPPRGWRPKIMPAVETVSNPRCIPQRFVDPYGDVYLRHLCRQPQVW